MKDSKFWVMVMGAFVFGVFVFALVNVGLSFTGFAVFGNSGSDFEDGVYNNTWYNGSGVVLSGDNLSGSYESEIFNAGADATWNNLSWVSNSPSIEFLYAVDGNGDVYKSNNYGVNWVLAKDSYGRGTATQGMFSDNTYLYIIVGGAREVWRSLGGITWTVINDSFNRDLEEGEADSNNKLYVVGADGTIWQSIDFGVSWIIKGDFNAGASNDAKGSCIDSNDNFYVTDGSKGVFVSSNEGVSWTEIINNYGGGEPDDIVCFGMDLYITRDKEVWKSNDSGVSWIEINHDAFNDNSLRADVFNDVLYVLDTKGKFYNSSDGVTWVQIGDMNPGDNDPKGLTNFIQLASLGYYVRSCDDDSCSGESWVEIVDPLSLGVSDNQYFQYKVDFVSPDSSVSSILESVDVDYDLVDSDVPQISFSSQTTESGEDNQDWINVGVDVSDESQIYSFIDFDNLLVGFWKMNDTGSVVKDYSGNENDGIINGASSTTGKFGNALSFDGDDKIEIQHSTSVSINTPYSISAWIKPSDVGGMGIITSKDEAVWEMMMMVSNGELFVGFEDCVDDNFLGQGGTIIVDNWQHVVYVYNGSRVLGYIDGVEVVNVDGSGTPCVSGHSLGIGDSQHGISYPFSGTIDEVLIFNRVLSGDEISALYNVSSYSNNFTNLEDGNYEFYSYAQDTSGNENQTEIRIVDLVSNVIPSLDIVNPKSQLYISNESLALDFVVSDSDGNLDSCWYNVDGGTNVSLVDCVNAIFSVGGSGNYVLNVYANDSEGLEVSDSVSFSVDIEGIDVNLSEPAGEKSSRVGIGIVYGVEGVEVSCWYNVETSIGGSVIGNISLVNCSGSSFGVSADGDYVLNLFVNNSYGSFDSDSSNFSVDTGGGTVIVNPPSGGSSSGGGGGYFVSSVVRLEADAVDVIVSRGEEKGLLVGVKNVGQSSANRCVLVGGNFVESDDVFNIGVGEIVEFGFVLRALVGVENFGLSVRCLDNVSVVVPLSVEVLEPSLDVEILGIGFDSNNDLKVDYSIEPTEDSVSVLYFRILDSGGIVVGEFIEEVSLVLGEVYEGSVLIGLDDVDEGMLRVVVSDGDVSFVEEDFVYGGGIGVTGFASFDWGGDFSYIGIILLVFLVLAGLLVRRIWKLRKGGKK